MRFTSVLALAGRRLLRRPFRSFLLLQGTVWGVAVAVFPSAVIAGTREAARTESAQLGADRISVTADPTALGGAGLRREDLVLLRDAVAGDGRPVLAIGAARVRRLWPAGPDDESDTAAWVESTPDVPVARGLELAAGRWLREEDPPDACVVEAGVAAWLGRSALAPEDVFVLPGTEETLRVVGVTRPRSRALRRTNDLGFDVRHSLYRSVGRRMLLALGIPQIRDAWKRSDQGVYVPLRGDAVDWIFLRVDPRDVRDASRLCSVALAARGRAAVTLHPLVLPFIAGRGIDRFNAVRTALFLACLVMGAVVMANLGLLTVLRRGREIAVRRVEGATRRDIVLHFVLEGVLLTALGSLLGCGLAMLLAELRVSVEPVTGFRWVFPWREAGIATGVALVIGALASLLPALRASGLEPVEALAEE